MLVLLMLAMGQPVEPPKPANKAPTITEVLYAVPKEGDADQDGRRSATGDEFIELVNPHETPINLKGYTLSDGKSAKGRPSKPGDKSGGGGGRDDARIHFTFPDLTLAPGEVAVVFNGYESSPPGPVGDEKSANKKNEKFSNAYVFSMRIKSQYTALANAGDCVLLSDPEGRALECVYWGDDSKKPEQAPPRLFKAPESRGSVQRLTPKGEFVKHQEMKGELADTPFSPGRFDMPGKESAPASGPKPENK